MIDYGDKRIQRLIRAMRDHNEFPIDLPRHYRPYSRHPVSVALKNAVAVVAAQVRSCSEIELKELHASLSWNWREMLTTDELIARGADALDECGVYLVADYLQGVFSSVKDALDRGADDRSEVFAAYPELRDLHTDEGLVVLQEPLDARPWGVFYKSHMLHYHQLLRRSFGSQPNMDFLGRLAGFQRSNPKTRVAVALDHRRLMPREYFREYFERDSWFGPPYREEGLDDPGWVGLTVIGKADPSVHPQNAAICRFDGIERCEVLWTFRDAIKTVQIEEVRATKTPEGLTINRYVHSQRDIAASAFVHLDGACKVYSEDQLETRLNSRLPEAPRARQKPKLFRIDGEIDLESWSELICFFLRGNPLILEYFANP